MTPPIPVALTIAGSDSGAGAGIQADLKTFSALGVYGTTALTALTAQNTRGVRAIHEVPPDFVRAQLDALAEDIPPAAVKTGMLAGEAIIRMVADWLAGRALPVVVDPVMVATSGDVLLAPDAIERMRSALLPLATLLTPNLAEAAALLDEPVAADESAMTQQGERLLRLGPGAVLVKGGHGAGEESADILVTPSGARRYAAPRIATRNTHGTGCTLSAAITARLALGDALPDAVSFAKAYVTDAIVAADRLAIGSGSGPLHHFHRLSGPSR